MAKMTFGEICNRLIAFFADFFNDEQANFTKGTNVKVTYNVGSNAWGAFADQINDLPWMVGINVLIAQKEMGARQTIGQVGKWIFDKQGAAKKTGKRTTARRSTGIKAQKADAKVRKVASKKFSKPANAKNAKQPKAKKGKAGKKREK
jgi:hypothetical protein